MHIAKLPQICGNSQITTEERENPINISAWQVYFYDLKMQIATETLLMSPKILVLLGPAQISHQHRIPRRIEEFNTENSNKTIKAPEAHLDQLHHQVELCGCVHLLYEHDDIRVLHSAQNRHFIFNQVFLFRTGWKFIWNMNLPIHFSFDQLITWSVSILFAD